MAPGGVAAEGAAASDAAAPRAASLCRDIRKLRYIYDGISPIPNTRLLKKEVVTVENQVLQRMPIHTSAFRKGQTFVREVFKLFERGDRGLRPWNRPGQS